IARLQSGRHSFTPLQDETCRDAPSVACWPRLMARSLKEIVFGKPRDLEDPRIFHNVSLIAFLAWVGLGADGLSSSAYGPEEAFKALGQHTFLAIFLALA